MAKYKIHKNMEDISEAEALPAGRYIVEIVEDPVIVPNWHSQNPAHDKADPERAGDDLLIKVEVSSPVEEFDGRALEIRLPWPQAKDAERRNQFGQTFEDNYLSCIANFARAFGGLEELEGDEVEFNLGAKCEVEVTNTYNEKSMRSFNNIPFYSKPLPVNA